MSNLDLQELRGHFDGQDPFMTGGHGIIKIRRGWRRIKPEWINSNKTIQALVLRSFPKLKTDNKQRVAAARWIRIIQLYFRMGWTTGQVAEELETTRNVIECVLKAIRRVMAGRGANNKGPRIKTGPGRPQKRDRTRASNRTPNENHRKVGTGAFV